MEKIKISARGEQVLNDPILNKGTAFTHEERADLGLQGLLPFHVSNIQDQAQRRYMNFSSQPTPLAKYVFLSSLQNRNEILFYRLISEHITEMLPLIYTPTVGTASTAFSSIYTQHRGCYFSYPFKEHMEEMVAQIPRKNIEVIVVTDGERILGLGDLGANGMAIPVGKLVLYTLFGGIHPSKVLPVLLDVGTNNETLLNNPLYLGWRHPRVVGKDYDDFVDRFVQAIKKRYPKVLLQWEDFSKPHARPLLERYRDQICSFNDDIQGTAVVVLSGILSAIKHRGQTLKDQRIAIFGGGSAGLGICFQILRAMREEGMNEQEALKTFYVVDFDGLIHSRLISADSEQKKYAQDFERLSSWQVKNPAKISLLEVVKNARPTILIGVSAQPGAFSQEIIQEMARHTDCPIIFPLSNPTEKSEAQPVDLIRWTQGKAIIATGGPFAPIQEQGKTYFISQCNNVYIFPGIGLGVIAAKASKVTDKMFLRAAYVLSEHAPILKKREALLFPHFETLRSVCREIGIAVAKMAQEEGVAPSMSAAEIAAQVDHTMWYPDYPTYANL